MRNMQATEPRVIKRLNLRETRSSRAALSIIVAVALLLAVIWLAIELLLTLTANTALLIPPSELAERTASVATATIPEALIAIGAGMVLVGLVIVAAALLPGTKPRHIMESSRAAVVVEHEVLAAAVSRTARTVARLTPEQVATSVSRKRIEVSLHPSTGLSVDTDAVQEAVEREVAAYGLHNPVAITVKPGHKQTSGTKQEVGI